MARRSDHTRAELRDLILNAACTLLKHESAEAITARSIAKIIGYTPGTIYNLFESMNDIYLHINAQTLDALYEALTNSIRQNKTATPIANIKAMGECYMAFAKEHGARWAMIFNLKMTEQQKHIDWYDKKVEKIFELLEELMAPFILPDQTQEKKTAARILWASVHGLCFLQQTDKLSLIGENDAAANAVTYLIDTFISGVKNKQQDCNPPISGGSNASAKF